MKDNRRTILKSGSYFLIGMAGLCLSGHEAFSSEVGLSKKRASSSFQLVSKPEPSSNKPVNIKASVQKGLAWLVQAQHTDGSWGAGSHAKQNIRDPHKVQSDPATTAFAAMTLIRSGNTPYQGVYKKELLKATEYLLLLVKNSKANTPNISTVSGTQPQTKLGRNIDISMIVQYFSRLLPLVNDSDPLYKRVDLALDKSIAKLKLSQNADGSSKGAGWAGVLQSSVGASALQMAEQAGKKIDKDVIAKSQTYNKSQFNIGTGKAKTEAAAGIELYSFSSSQRAVANDIREANDFIRSRKIGNNVIVSGNITISEEVLVKAGANRKEAKKWCDAAKQMQAQNKRLNDQRLLDGFGNNGGEEFLSYMQTSESLVIARSPEWKTWSQKIFTRLAKVQNGDGSWSGHHCITSPVFCTAASLMCMLVENDAENLRQKETVAKK